MRATKYVKIIDKPGKYSESVRAARGRSGVYMIFHKDQLRYVGHSGKNLYKTITRHFQSWDDPMQIRITYPQSLEYFVRIIFTTPRKAMKLERAIIVKYRPPDNLDKLKSFTEGDLTLTQKRYIHDLMFDSELPF